MWGQEKQLGASSRGQEGKGVGMGAANSKNTEGSGQMSAFVGKGVKFKGTISYSGTVSIDGYVEGEIHTDGALFIGDEAMIQAKITAGIIFCKGKITGNIVATEHIKLQAPAIIMGNMKTPILSMEDGVVFNGVLEMTHGVREIPQDASVLSIGVVESLNGNRVNV
ncbi:MAG TPA: polymer-forming cytoskeletal protein [Nitrospiraceae bacterium]|nr:polymer-forming cytoskeletal protein [Nitrospiraceae bacterium]